MCDKKSFDELTELFQTDPEAFEEHRKTYILSELTAMCADCPEHLERCKRFQWRLEQDLNKLKNPISRYNRMVELFWEQTTKLQNALHGNITTPEPKHDNNIVEFKSNK